MTGRRGGTAGTKVSLAAAAAVAGLALAPPLPDPASPGPRYGHDMVYDAARETTLLFGGFGPDGVPKGDTWCWDGSRWTRLDVEGPGPRGFQAMTYDPGGERIVLFGGRDGDRLLPDLWTWDGSRWERIDALGPRRRGIFASAWDHARSSLVIHGSGDRVDGQWSLEPTTWTWSDPAGWTEWPAPSAGSSVPQP